MPIEVSMPTAQVEEFNVEANDYALKLNLDLLEERKEASQLQLVEYQNSVSQYYNFKVKLRSFKIDDLVLWKILQHASALEPT